MFHFLTFDICLTTWHLFDNLISFWYFDTFNLNHLSLHRAIFSVNVCMPSWFITWPKSWIFRWFKFKLKPPYSGVHERSLSAIWDTSHWNFLSNLVSGQLETSLMTSYCHFWNLSTFGDSRTVWVFCPKLGVFRKSKFSRWRSDGASMWLWGF